MITQICRRVFAQFLLLLLFQNVFSQEVVVLPDGITEIKRFEFENKNITEINIPNSVVRIGESAFAGNNLKTISFPDNIVSVRLMAFARNKLETVIFSENIEFIDDYSFYCNQISSIEIPKNVRTIGSGAFLCNKLTSIIFSDYLYKIKDNAFANNQLKEVIIPNSVSDIGEYAFAVNELTNIELPKNIKLGQGAFCSNQLTTIIIPEGIYVIPAYAFFDNILSNVSFSKSVWRIGQNAFEYNDLNSIILKNIEVIETGAFKDNPLTEITIGENVSIGVKAMGAYSDEFIDAYEKNKRKAGIYIYDKSKKEWTYERIKSNSQIFQLITGTPFWGALGLFAALIFFLFTIIFNKKNQKSKPIYSNSNEYIRAMNNNDNRLQILWKNEVVENVKLVELVFWNAGRKSIRENDIPKNSPIIIKCKNEHVKILSYSVYPMSKNRETILLEDIIVDDEIQIVLSHNEAFEKGDGFQVYITYTCEFSVEDDWIIDANIVDAHKIQNERNVSVLRRLGQTFVYILAIVGFGLLPFAFIIIVEHIWGFYWNFYWIVFVIWVLSWGIFYFFTTEKKKHKKPKWK